MFAETQVCFCCVLDTAVYLLQGASIFIPDLDYYFIIIIIIKSISKAPIYSKLVRKRQSQTIPEQTCSQLLSKLSVAVFLCY